MPTKKVVIELEYDSDFESSTYTAIGDLLTFVEDSDFTIKDVTVTDAYELKLATLPNPVQPLGKAFNKKYRFNDYDGQ